MTRRKRIYPKDHSWKRWKVVAYNRVYETITNYYKTYFMARIDAFLEYRGSSHTVWVEIIDQRAKTDD